MPFADLVGHEAAIQLLKRQIDQDRVPHTYLLVGPKGIGKRALALSLSEALLCEKPRKGEACSSCSVCQRTSEGICPDRILVDPESKSGKTRIDQVRELIRALSLTPHGGRRKVGILETAESLTEEALHATLKLLEEPPEHSVLILLSAAPHRLPETVRSRCHRVRCLPQGIDPVIAFLKEKTGLSKGQATLLANASGGRLGQALFLQEEGVEEQNTLLDQLLAAHQKGEVEVALGTTSREQVGTLLEWYASFWRDGLILALEGDPAWIIHQDRMPQLKRFAGQLSVQSLIERVQRIYRAQHFLERNASPKTVLASVLSHSGESRG